VEPAATVAGGGAARETAGGAAEVRFAAKSVDELAPGMARVFAPPVAGAGPMAAANGDVVTLPAFTVTAERAGFAATAPARRRGGPELWGEEREYRPPAPAGAKFGRTTGEVHDNGFVVAAVEPRSTFAADTEAGSYLEVRRAIARQELPAREAVKIEELLNHFPYRYAAPAGERTLTFFEKLRGEDGAPPFAAALEVAEAPWAPGHRLVRVGLKGRDLRPAERPAANLVFLIDVSHSMQEPNKLPLVKESLRQLVGRLRADDRVAIVTYAGKSGLVLPSTPVERAREILAAIDTLAPRDAGTGATGLRLAYDVARGRFAEDGINRVILCTDGDFSLGAAGETELLRLVEERAGSGVFLSVLGFGMGSYRDATLEQLAWRGNGSHGYIDSRREAQRLLVEQVSGSLATIAKDVRVQVAFDPARVAQYRLIGYENRLLRQEDFDRESPGGGEIAAGHAVTALYEVIPAAGADVAAGGELLTVTVRYKKPGGLFARKAEYRLQDAGRGFAAASADFRFAAAVAQFGMMLRQSPYRGRATLGDVIAWAAAAAANPADDPGGYRGEFVDLVRAAQERWRSE
jgi:Ca-activated chloride channel family protein